MSYDLYMGAPGLTRKAFERYFAGRPHYREPGWYQNEDTGTYFSFEFHDPDDEAEDGDDDGEFEDFEGDDDDEDDFGELDIPALTRTPYVSFNLNYLRPHTFGLEAEPEVSAFIEAFGCAISDPQMDGMGDGPYSPEGFLKGWNAGNRFAYSSIGAQHGFEDRLLVGDAMIEAVWRWNRLRAETANELPNFFVPRLNWARLREDGAPVAAAIWGEGVAIAIPEAATHVILARQPRAPKRKAGLFSFLRRRPKQEGGVETRLVAVEHVLSQPGAAWKRLEHCRVLLAPADPARPETLAPLFEGRYQGFDAAAEPFQADLVLNRALAAPH